MSKIAITGGAGFVGVNLLRTLLNLEHEVVVVDDFSTGLRTNLDGLNCEIHEVSIEDHKNLKVALKDCEYIFHLAARGSVPRSIRNPRATLSVNVDGTLNVLECARETGAFVAFSSSSSVYGLNQELPKNEDMWTAPITPYASSKLAGESLVLSYSNSYGMPAVVYRFFNIFGPWQRPDHDYAAVVPKWIWSLMHGEKIKVYGDGNQTRDFTFIDSVIDILVRGMEEKLVHPRPINLAFGKRIRLNDLIAALQCKFPNMEVEYLGKREGDVLDSQNNPAKLFSIFDNLTPVEFDVALEKTIGWFNNFGELISNGPRVVD